MKTEYKGHTIVTSAEIVPDGYVNNYSFITYKGDVLTEEHIVDGSPEYFNYTEDEVIEEAKANIDVLIQANEQDANYV